MGGAREVSQVGSGSPPGLTHPVITRVGMDADGHPGQIPVRALATGQEGARATDPDTRVRATDHPNASRDVELPIADRLRHASSMVKIRALLLVSTIPVMLACSNDAETTTVVVEGTLTLCPAAGNCRDVPASGAEVELLSDDGATVASATLDRNGRYTVEVPAGRYSAALALPDLDLQTVQADSPVVRVAAGDEAVLALALPPVQITR